mmetsp:Transcript_3022/g.7739  ORF Transcript_3022/g.7739 Transcript_3022/m.7739 type:complete len:99 (+) Transcript_3022:92-388(+)
MEGQQQQEQQQRRYVTLKVKDQHGSEVQFRLGRCTPMRKLRDAYCTRAGLRSDELRLMVDGERISPDDIAEKLGLEDDDLLDAATEQHGGSSKRRRTA